MPHLDSVQDPGAWTKYGVKKISQLIQEGKFLSYGEMRQIWNIPESYAFRYRQLSHAIIAQFPEGTPQLMESEVEQMIKGGKRTISKFYGYLINITPYDISKLKENWKKEAPGLKNWEEVWRFPLQILVSLRDKLIQYKIIHRSHYTPYKLHRISPSNSQNCWRCVVEPGDFIHIFWLCPKIVAFWSEILTMIARVTSVRLEQEVEICLLGLIEGNAISKERKTQIGLLLFYARKVIVLNWKKIEAPSIAQWKNLVNSNLILYRETYCNRGHGEKYRRIWANWIENPITASG